MITKIIIKNFQSHKKTILNLTSGLNVIVGTTDSGKSAIRRAIELVVSNRPTGDSFRSYWGGDTSVSLVTSEGHKVTRNKTDKNNSYVIDSTETLKAFGVSVPNEVSNILNLTELNMQQQMDAPFLLSKNPGEVAAHFNKIANIEVIDKSIALAKLEKTRVNQSIKQREDDLKEKQSQLEKYVNLNELEKELDKIQGLDDSLVDKKVELAGLEKLIQQLKDIEVELKACDDVIAMEAEVLEILELDQQKAQKEKEQKGLQALVSNLSKIEAELVAIDNLIALEPDVLEINELQLKRGNLQAELNTISSLIGEYTSCSTKVANLGQLVVKLEGKLPEVCPVCGGTGKLK